MLPQTVGVPGAEAGSGRCVWRAWVPGVGESWTKLPPEAELTMEASSGPGREPLSQKPRRDPGAGPPQGSTWAFPEGPVSSKNPQNPTGGVSMWAAVTLKGCCNRTFKEASLSHQGGRLVLGPSWGGRSEHFSSGCPEPALSTASSCTRGTQPSPPSH